MEGLTLPLSRVADLSLTSTRSPSQPPNKTIPTCTREATLRWRLSVHSSTLDDSNERLSAYSSPNSPSTPRRPLPQPEREESLQPTTDTMLCSLERLPAEIQTRILVESSLASLQALIRSSPRFYYVYCQDRLLILKEVLNSVLDGMFLDAYAACHYDSYWAAVTGTPWLPLDFFLENPDTAPLAPVIDGLSLAVAQKMAQFHFRVVEPLTERYARWALGALSSSPQAAPLTKIERSRIQRAMYRLQVICNLGISEPRAILEVLDSFGPWAAEQIICVHEFAKERCSSVSMECAWELDNMEPILGPLEGLLPYTGEYINERSVGTILSQGLSVLQETYQAEDLEELCWVIKKTLEYSGSGRYHGWIDEAVCWQRQFDRRYESYSKHDEAQDTRQEMRFEQDELLSPPLAWVTFWDGRYSNQIGTYIPHALHRWGYVMWDAKRLKDSGAMQYIELEWQCEYGTRGSPEEDDPREYYIAAYQLETANDS